MIKNMKTLYIDTHCTKTFEIGYENEQFTTISGSDASLEILEKIEFLTKNQIERIIICTGPGSLTGLRIGSCFANGIALAKNIEVYGLSLWNLLFEDISDLTVLFHTGTKKWIYKKHDQETLVENPSPPDTPWTSNRPDLLVDVDKKMYQNWPNIIQLMHKNKQKASKNIDLLYPVDLFSKPTSL